MFAGEVEGDDRCLSVSYSHKRGSFELSEAARSATIFGCVCSRRRKAMASGI